MDEPSVIRAGDTIAWQRDVPQYPAADGWVLRYRVVWPTGTPQSFAATHLGANRWAVDLAAATTAGWAAGAATLVAYVDRSSPTAQRETLSVTPLAIEPNIATVATFDARSQAQRALEDLRAALASYARRGHVSEYEIAGRRVRFRNSAEIVALIDHYEREVARERRAAGLLPGAGGHILVRG